MRLRLTVVLTIAVALVFSLVSAPTPAAAQAKVEKLIFASAGFEDTNRYWVVARPDHLQFDPFLETLLEVDPKTGAYTPRLAEKWQASPDFRQWTFWLRKGVQFHFGYGPFTAKDVVHSYALTQRPEAKMTLGPFWKGVEEVKTVKIYHGKGCTTCNKGGYKGRTGLYEVMEINDELRELILVGASALELKKKAIEQGMITLRRSGLIKVAAGQTTMEEVLRETVL